MPLALFVTAVLLLFGVYSFAPLFGIDELYPELFRPYGPLSWAVAALVFIGAGWWAVRYLQGKNPPGSKRQR